VSVEIRVGDCLEVEAFIAPTVDSLGRVAYVCPLCERNRLGLCRDCNAKRAPRSMRCVKCRRARHLALDRARDRARYPIRRQQVLASHRKRNALPAVREHRRRYMQAYRANAKHDPRDLAAQRTYQRVYMQQRRLDASYRAKQNARKRELRALKKLQSVERAA